MYVAFDYFDFGTAMDIETKSLILKIRLYTELR